jgi:hypothetical protein
LVAVRAGHAAPQPPQCETLFVVLTSHPSAPFELQSPKPALQMNPQADPEQKLLALARAGHALPQAPQCETLLVVLVSQPFAALPSQLPKPAVHEATRHEPEAHVAEPFATEQPTPQPPQCVVLLSGVSQPLLALPSQLPKPVVQPASAHEPALHAAVPFAYEHDRPHIPQWLVEVSGVSHPLLALPSQSPKPALHVYLQLEAEHEAVELARAGHALPQEPQWLRSVAVSTQDIPQRTRPPAHPLTHRPVIALHTGEAPEHEAPHEPQFEAVPSGVSQPLAALPSQFAKPGLHAPIAHPPAVHTAVALASEHVRPHAPQLASSVLVSTQDMPQRVRPTPQPEPHVPPEQMGVAPVHARPHMPQLLLLLSAVSQPFALIASQSPKPAAQVYWHCPAASQLGTMLGRGAHDPQVPPQLSLPHSRPAQMGVHPSGAGATSRPASCGTTAPSIPASIDPSIPASLDSGPASLDEPASGNTNCAS